MDLAVLSSWPPRPCGIADYSHALVTHLRPRLSTIAVLCHPAQFTDQESVPLYPVLDTPDWLRRTTRTLATLRPNIVHLQHEFGLYQRAGRHDTTGIQQLFRWCAEQRLPIMTTLHTTYPAALPDGLAEVVRSAPALIVHGRRSAAAVHALLGPRPTPVYVVPHGVEVDRQAPRAAVRPPTPGQPVIGLVGWFSRAKGWPAFIRNWPSIRTRLMGEATLLIAGSLRPGSSAQDRQERAAVRAAIAASPERASLRFREGPFAGETFEALIASVDVLALPYREASSSGILARALALGVPAVVTDVGDLPDLLAVSGQGAVIAPEGVDQAAAWSRAVRRVLNRASEPAVHNASGRRWQEQVSWSSVAAQHVAAYQHTIGLGHGASSEHAVS